MLVSLQFSQLIRQLIMLASGIGSKCYIQSGQSGYLPGLGYLGNTQSLLFKYPLADLFIVTMGAFVSSYEI